MVTNTEPTRQELVIPIPKAAEEYYEACAMIDRHNRSRQDNLQLERKLGTLEWYRRVNMSFVGVNAVDSWLAWNGIFGSDPMFQETEKEFYVNLAEELIDNDYDVPAFRRRRRHSVGPSPPAVAYSQDGTPRSGLGVHLTPTKRLRKGSSKHLLQGHCKICDKKTTTVCSTCKEENPTGKDYWVCDTRGGRPCFAEHVAQKHTPGA